MLRWEKHCSQRDLWKHAAWCWEPQPSPQHALLTEGWEPGLSPSGRRPKEASLVSQVNTNPGACPTNGPASSSKDDTHRHQASLIFSELPISFWVSAFLYKQISRITKHLQNVSSKVDIKSKQRKKQRKKKKRLCREENSKNKPKWKKKS